MRTRDDVDFSRHVVSGEPSYVVHDPVTFVSHSLGRDEYDVFVSVDAFETLGETFADLCERRVLEPDREDEFYEYVIGLHQLGLLVLPMSDDKALFERFEKKRRAARRGKVLGFMFLRVPLWNPDAFLKRTLPVGKLLFSGWFVALYLVALGLSGAAAVREADALAAPLLGLLDVRNVWLLWTILIVNKLFHEFGHAYACRAMGGAVPEMGAFFIVFTPCAYVDASSSWGFSSRWRRMVVNLGGVYFESMLAVGALWVWLLTEPGLLNTAAYQVLIMASVVTVLFNMNPLAKFDGYYVLSDLVNIPNLRQRASEQLSNVFCRVALGERMEPVPYGFWTRVGLFVFAVAGAVYRVTLVLTLSAMVASKFFLFGVAMAGFFVGMSVFGAVMKAVKLFVLSDVAARRRLRASLVGLGLFVGAPALLAVAPMPRPVEFVGVIEHSTVRVLRAASAGVVSGVFVEVGDAVAADGVVVELENRELRSALARSRALAEAAAVGVEGSIGDSWGVARAERALVDARSDEAFSAATVDGLLVASPVDGVVVRLSEAVERRASVKAGDVLGEVGGGGWVAVLYVDDSGAADATPSVGDRVSVRLRRDASVELVGTVVSVSPSGETGIRHVAVTQAGGGPIPVDASTGEAAKAYAEVRVELEVPGGFEPVSGGLVYARFDAKVEAVGDVVARRVMRFIETLRTQ